MILAFYLRYLLVCLLFVVFSGGYNALAQPSIPVPAEVSPDQGGAQSIAEQVKGLKKNLAHLQQLLDNGINVPYTAKILQQLSINKNNIEKKINALKQTNTSSITQANISQNQDKQQALEKAVTANNSRIKALRSGESMLDKAQATQHSLLQLLSNPVNQSAVSDGDKNKIQAFAEQISQIQQQFETKIEELTTQQRELEVAIDVLKRWGAALSEMLISQSKQQSLLPDSTQNTSEQDSLKMEVSGLQTKLSQNRSSMDLPAVEALQQSIYEKQTLLWLITIDQSLNQLIEHQTLNIDIKALENLPLLEMKQQRDLLLATQSGLNHLRQKLEERYLEWQKYTDIVGARPALEDAFTQRMKGIALQLLLLKDQPHILNERITAKNQETLFQLDALYTEKPLLLSMQNAPQTLLQMLYQVKISFQILWQAILAKPFFTLLPALIGVLVAITLLRKLRYRLRKVGRQQRSKTITFSDTLSKTWYLLRKRYYYLYIFLIFLALLVYLSDVPYPSNAIIWTLQGVLVVTLIWLSLIRVELKQNMFSPRYARYSYIATLILSVAVVCYCVALMSAIPPTLLSLYEKVLMLALIVFVWVERKKMKTYLSRRKETVQGAVYRIYLVMLNLLSLPWLIIAIAMVSLVGYGRLAWMMLAYVSVIILYLIALALGLKLVNHWRKRAKLYSIRRFQHGAFIASDIVSPLSTICKILWFLGVTVMLFTLMGWNKDNYLIVKFLFVIQYPWATFGETVINLQMIALSLLALYIIFRAAKWLRTFSYHWLYARIKDLGIRGSLSIFSQYVAVMIGLLLALKFLGIDLTSLAVFAGALGVGVGLGLQDIAKNFISGILLLIERPLRNGDWISLDGNEGTVKSIGMRAITIETFDRQEVIIPNGSAIGNSLVNNTHSNTLLRTVLYVGAGYDSPPETVIHILTDILSDIPAILVEPQPMVILWEYADSSINYRVQYYLNIQTDSLLDTRTAVLNRIWHEFKANNIEIPFPQRDVHLRKI